MHKAMFFNKLDGDNVQCTLCPHMCKISQGLRGICNVRENNRGELESLVYAKIIAAHVDPIEKKPLFHMIPGSRAFSLATAGCNFQCSFCQNYTISQVNQSIISGESMSPEDIVKLAENYQCSSLSFTYTEPTIFFEYAYDTAKLARERGLLNNFVTNGFMSLEALNTVAPFLDAANVDLKAFKDETYKKWMKGRLAPVLETLREMKKLGIWVEVTTLLVPGLNDSFEELTGIASFIAGELGRDTPWHVSRFHPDFKTLDKPPTPVQSIDKAIEIGKDAGLFYIYSGNVPGKKTENTYCYSCQTLLIERIGFTVKKNRISECSCPECGSIIHGIFRKNI